MSGTLRKLKKLPGFLSEHVQAIVGSTEAGAAWDVYFKARREQLRAELETEPRECPEDLKEDWRVKLGMTMMLSELIGVKEGAIEEIGKLEGMEP